MNNQEDPIERLARRTAEENDRMTRQRQQEWRDAAANPIFPRWFLWLGLGLGVIGLFGVLKAFGM